MSKEVLFSVTKKDLNITWFSGTGKGGQHRNKHQNCCRIRHKESGALVTAQNQRSRDQNLKTAFDRLANNKKFKVWVNKRIYELSEQRKLDEQTINNKVDEEMKEENLDIQYYDPDKKDK